MKNKIIGILSFSLLFAAFSGFCSDGPIQGKSFTEFGDYTVTPSDEAMNFNGKDLITYELVYSNLKQPVKIGVDNRKNCKIFIVKYPSFEVQYNCTKRSFGVRRMEDKFVSINPVIVDGILDFDQFARQELILTESKPDTELLHLIACYFPSLMDKKIRQVAQN